MNRVAIVISLGFLICGGLLTFNVNRIANSLEYGEIQARKFEPIVDRAEQQLNLMLNGGR